MAFVEDYRIDVGGGQEVTVTFEPADPSDPTIAQSLLDVDLQTFTEATFSHFAARALLTHGAVFVLRYSGEIIGSAVCVRSWNDPGDALLLSMGILHGWRGRGVGQRFVASIQRALARQDFESLTLQVLSTNHRALHVYRELGFLEIATEPVKAGGRDSMVHLRSALSRPAIAAAS